MKFLSSLFLGFVLLISCKKSSRVIICGYVKEYDHLKIFINENLIFEKTISKSDYEINFSRTNNYNFMTEIIDYSFYSSRIKYSVNLYNKKEKIIDTTIYKNTHQLPFLIELDLKENNFNLPLEKENKYYKEFDKRNIRIIDKFDEEFPLWRMFFENTK